MIAVYRAVLRLALLVCASSFRLRWAGSGSTCSKYYYSRISTTSQLFALRDSVEPSRISLLLDSVQKPLRGLRGVLSRQNASSGADEEAPAAVVLPAKIVLMEQPTKLPPMPERRLWGRVKDAAVGARRVSLRSLRRRLFNLWERQPQWAQGLGRESSDQSLVSTPEVRRLMAAESLRVSTAVTVPKNRRFFSGVGNALGSLFRREPSQTSPMVVKALPYNGTAYGGPLPPSQRKEEDGDSSEEGVSFSLDGVTGQIASFFRSAPASKGPPALLPAAAIEAVSDAKGDEPLRGMLSKSGAFIGDIFPVTGQLVRLFGSVSPRPLPAAEEASPEASLQSAELASSPPAVAANPNPTSLKYALDATVALGRRAASATLPLAKVLLDRAPDRALDSNSSLGADLSLYFNINGDIAGKEDFSFMDREAMLAGITSLPAYLLKSRLQLSDGFDGIRRDSFSVISSAINDSSASAGQIIDYAAAFPAAIPAYAYDTISNNARWLYNSMPNLQQMQQLARAESLSSAAATAAPPGFSNGAPQQAPFFDTGYAKPTNFATAPLIDARRAPLPAKTDFAYIGSRRMAAAVTAAQSVSSAEDSRDFSREIGLKPLLAAATSAAAADLRPDAVKGLFRLLLQDSSVADAIVDSAECMEVLVDMVNAPVKSFRSPFRSAVEREREAAEQYEAVRLLHRMVRCSERAADILKEDARVRRVFGQLLLQQADYVGSLLGSPSTEKQGSAQRGGEDDSLLESTFNRLPARLRSKTERQRFLSNSTIIMEFPGLSVYKMSRVISAALGGVLPWKPRQPGQKGLRILSFDGGGTRGVLSIAIMKELMLRVGKKYPHEIFDVICGTSTGGIIACLFGAQRRSVDEMEVLYDDLIEKIFGRKSNLKLVSEQALYDETELERTLHSISGDELFLDSNRADCARTFCVSTKVNTIPQTQIWRNYNYPAGQRSRYPGAFRVNTLTAIRATTAAPTFFTPVQWEGGLYCDGALVANNPTALALQEAKATYPGVPVEYVVSIGTGAFSNAKDGPIQSMGWDLLVNQIIASSTDTEDVHSVLIDFLPPDKYFRFNPTLPTNLAIDETDKIKISGLKELGKRTVRAMEAGPDAKRMEAMIRAIANKK